MKKNFLLYMIGITSFLFMACSDQDISKNEQNEPKTNKIQIITTLFPQYDFAKQIVGDRAEVTLLLPTGVESHAYEPTPKDILAIHNADLFVYTGENMEAWVPRLLTDINTAKTTVIDLSATLDLETKTHTHAEDEHTNEAIHTNIQKEDEHGHTHDGNDPHIWTNPLYAKEMMETILAAVVSKDPGNETYYTENAQNYIQQIDEIHDELEELTKNAKRKKIIFAGHFALSYFTEQYGLEYIAAYPNTSSESEPSVKDITNMIDVIQAENIPVIYYEELTEPKIAKSIQEQTGVKTLLLHSLHNVSKEEFEQGVSYVSIMKQNIENLKEGLN